MQLRITVEEAWDTVLIEVGEDTSIGDVKREALERTVGGAVDDSEYVVKFRGATVWEGATPKSLGAPDAAAMIVLHTRRKPVR